MNWRWISIAALLATLLAGYAAFNRRDPSEVLSEAAPPQPGYFLRDAIITQTEKDGGPGIRLLAQRIDQRSAEDSIHLTNVRVDSLRTAERQWTLTAEQGIVPSGWRVIEVSGDVHLRPLDDTTTTAYLRTDALAFDIARNVAYSVQSPVDIRFNKVAMKVKRFEADLNSEKVKLESIRGHSERQ